jgi:nitrate/TMAO reductase-like tetraheme cytochrome c subunit
MEFNRIKKRKKPNKSKLILLLIVLIGIIYFWLNANRLMEFFF